MVYTKTTWADGKAGGTSIDAVDLNKLEQGVFDAHTMIASVAGGNGNNILIDTLTSSTDPDEMLLAADFDHRSKMGTATNPKYAPTYYMGIGKYTFDQVFNPCNGFKLRGSNWVQSSAYYSSTHPSHATLVELAITPTTAGQPVPWIDARYTRAAGTASGSALIDPTNVGKALWDFNIGHFNVYSNNALNYLFRGPYVSGVTDGYRECGFYNIVAQRLYSVFGTNAEGCSVTICDINGGGWQIIECRDQGVTLQGSDCGTIFGQGCDWFNIGQDAGNERWMGELRSLGKSNVGPIYITAANGWRGLKVTGGSSTFGLVVTGAKIEGNNAGDECHGSLVRVEGGTVGFRDCTIDDGMSNPGLTANKSSNGAQADRGLVEILGNSHVYMDGIHVAHGNTPALTTPVVYASGNAEVYLSKIMRGVRGQAWSAQKPVVSGSPAGGLYYDQSVSFV